MSVRTVSAIRTRSMPAWASSSAGVPEVGITRTASVTIRGRELLSANTSSTASPIPPSGWWSSTVTITPVASAASIKVCSSIGLTE